MAWLVVAAVLRKVVPKRRDRGGGVGLAPAGRGFGYGRSGVFSLATGVMAEREPNGGVGWRK